MIFIQNRLFEPHASIIQALFKKIRWLTGFGTFLQGTEICTAGTIPQPYVYSSSDHFTLVPPDLTYERGLEDESIPLLNFAPVPKALFLMGKYYHSVMQKPVKFLKLRSIWE